MAGEATQALYDSPSSQEKSLDKRFLVVIRDPNDPGYEWYRKNEEI